LAAVHRLIKEGANPSLKDGQGFNALHLAVHSSQAMLVLYLLYLGMDIDSIDTVGGHTPLMWAAYQGDALTVDSLLRFGANINATDNTKLTPLHWAVVKGNKICIRKMLEYGANPDVRDENGKTPLDFAKEKNLMGVWGRAVLEFEVAADENPNMSSRVGHIRGGPTGKRFSKVWMSTSYMFNVYVKRPFTYQIYHSEEHCQSNYIWTAIHCIGHHFLYFCYI
jgi:hypothetical protein